MAGKLNEITLAVQEENRQVDEIAINAKDLNSAISYQFDLLASFNQDEVLLQTVKADHIARKIRLVNMAMGGEIIPDNELVDHTQCRLGRWYYSAGQQRYGRIDAFQQMEAPHARFHEIGKEIAQLSINGQSEAACQKIDELDHYSSQLSGLIDDLIAQIQT